MLAFSSVCLQWTAQYFCAIVIPTEHRHFHGIYFPLYAIIFHVMCIAQLLLVNGLKNNA